MLLELTDQVFLIVFVCPCIINSALAKAYVLRVYLFLTGSFWCKQSAKPRWRIHTNAEKHVGEVPTASSSCMRLGTLNFGHAFTATSWSCGGL